MGRKNGFYFVCTSCIYPGPENTVEEYLGTH